MKGDFRFLTNCVNAGGLPFMTYARAGEAINQMKDAATQVTRKTFMQHVNREDLRELEDQLGYARHYKQGLVMANDYHVSYWKGVFAGEPCFYFDHSLIEHIFTRKEPFKRGIKR